MDNYTDLIGRYPDDPALSYAIGVLNGTIISGEKIKQACKRHINDLRRIGKDDAFIYIYDSEQAKKIVEFSTLLKDVTSGEPFEASPYQKI